MMNTRKTQVLRGKGWVDISMLDLEIGDLFRMFEQDGTPVKWDDETQFIATSKPYTSDLGINTIQADKINGDTL